MNLAIDIGNTNINIALFSDQTLQWQAKLDTIDCQTTQDFNNWLKQFDLTQVQNVGLSCVVPRLYVLVKRELNLRFNKLFVVTPDNLPDLEIKATDRNELGADLLAVAIGAIHHYPIPSLIVDMGSANKVVVVNHEGAISGVIIQPGIKMSFEAMVGNIKQLPKIDFAIPPSAIGYDTITALQSGLLYGAIDSMSGLCDRISEETKQQYTKILTGGYSNLVHTKMEDFIFDPDLLLNGINDILLERFG